MNYRLLSAAEAELAEVAAWYESQSCGLGQQFLDEFEVAMDQITHFPCAWRQVSARHRRCLFRRFPYAVIYTTTSKCIVVSAIADLRRDPARIEHQMDES